MALHSSYTELQLSAGLRAVSLKARESGVFQDLVVNTRQKMTHVQETKTGKAGDTVNIFTNHFRLTSCPQWVAYKYNVDYKPDVEDGNLRASLLFQHESELGKCHIFDGNSLLLPQRLSKSKMEVVSQTSDKTSVKITLELSKELTPASPECLRYYNILFRRVLRLMDLKQVGRNYYNNKEAIEFHKHNLEIWPGYITSILQYENSITLCADVSHKLLRKETAYDLIKSLTGSFRAIELITEKLVGLIVLTRYNNKTYKVDAIDWKRRPSDIFEKSDGTEITFVEYYKQHYKEVITDLDQPLLISQGKWKMGQKDTDREPILLIPELCYLTGLSSEISTKYWVMRDLAAHMRLDPKRRQYELAKFVDSMQKNEAVQKELQFWDLKFDSNCMYISGRVYRDKRDSQNTNLNYVDPPKLLWTNGLLKNKLARPKSLDRWLLLYPPGDHRLASDFMKNLQKITIPMHIDVKTARMVEARNMKYVHTLEEQDTSNTQMVVCILPSNNKQIYDMIKEYLCTTCPIPSQCVVARTLKTSNQKTKDIITEKIALQINCKMGGALWKVDEGEMNVMFIGIDCFHDVVRRQRSIAGFVASSNKELTRWYSKCIFQEPGQELVYGLISCVEGALDAWYRNNQCLPNALIVYRDGVGDGQLQALLDKEIPQILSCLQTPDVKLNLTFIVVKKRINTRFFIESEGNLQNPEPGTIVDMELTRKEWYDFFIVSQIVREGTVTPTHYNVIYDTLRLDPDSVQCITYRLCYMYFNLSGIIRVPAPCHYAHKLAYLVGQSIHQEPHRLLSECLYYL
ncbi:piwi-like protein 3 [Tupaia chinensis]|uniref:piwi-like protein 3 n=1 Tax=Tupaia chinensis TaxID=246437 RepID=UPI000FFBB09B|nr:piwi-like protein 3 [Tupaia chinensis]